MKRLCCAQPRSPRYRRRVAVTGDPIMLLPRWVIIAGCVDGPGAVVCGESVSLRALGWTVWFSGPGRKPS